MTKVPDRISTQSCWLTRASTVSTLSPQQHTPGCTTASEPCKARPPDHDHSHLPQRWPDGKIIIEPARQFAGAIDEIPGFKRVFAEKEIARLYEVGTPE